MMRLATMEEAATLRAAGMIEHDDPDRWWRPMWPDNGDGRPRHISTDDAIALVDSERAARRRACVDAAMAQAAAMGDGIDMCVSKGTTAGRAWDRMNASRSGVETTALGAVIDALRVARDLLAADHGKMCQEAVREIDDTLLRDDVRHAVPPHLIALIEGDRARRR